AATSSVLIETPMRYDDPNRLVQDPDRTSTTTDKNYYTNEKLRITSQPIVASVVKQLGLTTEYYRWGLIDRPLYPVKPIIMEVDSSSMPSQDAIPNDITFYVTRVDGNTFHLEGDGKYGPTRREIDVDRKEHWGEWFMLDSLRLRVQQAPVEERDSTATTYGFRIRDPRDVALDLISSITSDFVETDATTVLLNYTSAPAARTIDILNAVSQAYVNTHMSERSQTLDATIAQVQSEINHNLALLDANSNAVESFRTAQSVTDVDHEKVMLMERSDGLDKQRETLTVKDKYYSYLQKLLSEQSTSDQPISPKAFGIQDPILNDMTEQLVSLQSDIAALKNDGKTAHPYYTQLTQRLDQQRTNILKSVEGFKETNNMMLANINQQYSKLASQQNAIPKTERELDDKSRDAKTLDSQHGDLLTRLANLRIARAAIAPEVRLITPAYLTSTDPYFPNIVILLVVAVLLSLLFPLGYLVIKGLFSDRVQSTKDVARALPNAPLLGQIPFTGLTDPDALIARPVSQAFIEISKLARGLELMKPSVGPEVSVISNANTSGSGRTFTHMLAAVLAARGNRTLIIDTLSDEAASAPANHLVIQPYHQDLDKAILTGNPGSWASDIFRPEGYSQILIIGPSASALPAWTALPFADHALVICEIGKTGYATLEELALAQLSGKLPELGLVVNKVLDDRLPWFGFFSTKKEKRLSFWGGIKYNWRRAV
ncbi:MAG: hypothetical protein ABI373_00075, partial [Flavobacteriales bacterium]